MFRTLPVTAVILGIAGLIPYLFVGLLALGGNDTRSLAAVQALVAYGAVTLSFVGAVHWGFVLGIEDEEKPSRVQLSFGVVPALIGWAAMVMALVGYIWVGLGFLIAGFIGVLVYEHRLAGQDRMPGGYMALRWILTVTVVALLTTVLVMRIVGAHVLI